MILLIFTFSLDDAKIFQNGKKFFSANSYNEETSLKFFDKLSENEKLTEENQQKIKEKNFEDFKKFISDTYIHQLDYDRLLMRITERKRGKEDRTSCYEYYLRELPPIKQKQQIFGNFAEIKRFSGSIYSCEIADYVDNLTLYDLFKRYEPILLKGGSLYSLDHTSDCLKNYLKEGTLRENSPEDFIYENPDNLSILQTLYKKYILNFGVVQGGCSFLNHRNSDILYFPHADYSKLLRKVEGKQVSRLFDYAKPPFVKHEAIEIEVKVYDQRWFVFFNPMVLFTDNNKELITGRDVRRLHEKFSPNKFDNNLSIFGDMKWWFDFLCRNQNSSLKISKLSCFIGKLKPPQDSKMRNCLAATQRMEKYF